MRTALNKRHTGSCRENEDLQIGKVRKDGIWACIIKFFLTFFFVFFLYSPKPREQGRLDVIHILWVENFKSNMFVSCPRQIINMFCFLSEDPTEKKRKPEP